MLLYVASTGEWRKVSCESCIRGHRSTKCQHKERFLFEVRKPGRPLSNCPHPVGKCPGSCGCYQPAYVVPGHAAMQIRPETGQEFMEGRRIEPHEYPPEKELINSADNFEKALASDARKASLKRRRKAKPVPSSPSNSTAPPQKELTGSPASTQVDYLQPLDDDPFAPPAAPQEQKRGRVRLGMFGIGGFNAGKDEVGWSEQWPEASKIDQKAAKIANNMSTSDSKPAESSCCSNSQNPATRHSHHIHDPPVAQSPNSRAPSSAMQSFAKPPTSTNGHWSVLSAVPANSVDPNISGDSCTCLSELECLCNGCAKHPGNPTNRQKMSEIWSLMGSKQYQDADQQSLNSPSIHTDMLTPNVLSSPFIPDFTHGNDFAHSNSLELDPNFDVNDFNEQFDFAPYVFAPEPVSNGCGSINCKCGEGCLCVGCQRHDTHRACTNVLGGCKCGEGCPCYGCLTHHVHTNDTMAPLPNANASQFYGSQSRSKPVDSGVFDVSSSQLMEAAGVANAYAVAPTSSESHD